MNAPATARTLLRTTQLRLQLPRLIEAQPLPQLLESLTPRQRARRSSGLDPDARARIFGVTDRLLRTGRWLKAPCLQRALIRYVLLREEGVDARFVMGVRKADGELIGHAWVEHQDGPLMEILSHDYDRTFAYPNES